MTTWPNVWRVRKYLPERFGARCRVLARGRGPGPRNCLVEFQRDGVRVVSFQYATRHDERPTCTWCHHVEEAHAADCPTLGPWETGS